MYRYESNLDTPLKKKICWSKKYFYLYTKKKLKFIVIVQSFGLYSFILRFYKSYGRLWMFLFCEQLAFYNILSLILMNPTHLMIQLLNEEKYIHLSQNQII